MSKFAIYYSLMVSKLHDFKQKKETSSIPEHLKEVTYSFLQISSTREVGQTYSDH